MRARMASKRSRRLFRRNGKRDLFNFTSSFTRAARVPPTLNGRSLAERTVAGDEWMFEEGTRRSDKVVRKSCRFRRICSRTRVLPVAASAWTRCVHRRYECTEYEAEERSQEFKDPAALFRARRGSLGLPSSGIGFPYSSSRELGKRSCGRFDRPSNSMVRRLFGNLKIRHRGPAIPVQR